MKNNEKILRLLQGLRRKHANTTDYFRNGLYAESLGLSAVIEHAEERGLDIGAHLERCEAVTQIAVSESYNRRELEFNKGCLTVIQIVQISRIQPEFLDRWLGIVEGGVAV